MLTARKCSISVRTEITPLGIGRRSFKGGKNGLEDFVTSSVDDNGWLDIIIFDPSGLSQYAYMFDTTGVWTCSVIRVECVEYRLRVFLMMNVSIPRI